MAKKMGHKRLNTSGITWLLLVICTAAAVYHVWQFPLLTRKVKYIGIGIAAVVLLLLGFLSLRKKQSAGKIISTILNTILCIAMIAAAVFVPSVSTRIHNVIIEDTDTEENVINVYALTTDYKAEHADIFKERGLITSANINDYSGKQFITQSAMDQENQSYVLNKLAVMYNTDHVWTNETASVWDAVDAMYDAEGDALILNAAYESTIEEEYPSFTEDTIILYSFNRTVEKEKEVVEESLLEPFALFIAGSDSRDAELTSVTRTDVDIVAVVSPAEEEILLISLPRDSYIENPALGNQKDKLTHMGIYGLDNSCAALSQFLDISLDKYMLVNFNSYTSIIDTIGGIDIENPYAFTSGTNYFEQGTIHLDGTQALSYVRERYNLTDGDFGRNEHQIIVLKAILKKVMTAEVLSDYQNVLESLKGTFLTNVSTDSIFEMISSEITSIPNWNVVSRHIIGTTGMSETASMPGRELSVVYPDETALAEIKTEIKKLLEP